METQILALAEAGALDAACRTLADGGLVAVPTETVYGLAADATDGVAVARIYEAKGRPSFNPLIAHVADMDMARRHAVLDDLALRLAEAFWPGPMTLVLPAREASTIHPLVRAGLPTVALRMPLGPLGDIARKIDRPLAAPSANPSGRVSATRADHVRRGLGGRIEAILDGGPCRLGLESTILKPENGQVFLLRPGALPAEDVAALIGAPVLKAGSEIQAPGQLASHYAPFGRIRLNARSVEPGEHLIAFGSQELPGQGQARAVLNLSDTGDLREAAAALFDALSSFDAPDIERIAVAAIPNEGLGAAINDRLARAAAPRDTQEDTTWTR